MTELILEGHMPPGREKFYLDVPFDMPTNVTRLDVRYEYSHAIGSDPHLTGGNTVDIGIFDWRGADFLNTGFRGWTGSARTGFYITHTDATPGYMPGPLSAGTWFICLGFYKVGPQGCDYKITIGFTQSVGAQHVAPLQEPTFPQMLTLNSPNATITSRADGWYKGEMHCHTVHSDGDSTPQDVINYAESLGLDFLAITDHNNMTHLADMAALGVQNLILIPGCEATTYKGHWNIWGLEEWVDFRVLSPEMMERAIEFAVQRGYLTSCNHPRQFGPPWEYEDVEGYHCVEVWNGPWRLFNHEALAFWERKLRQGKRLVAVGGSDSHRLKTEHHARVGIPTLWIHCPEPPTSTGLLAGLRAGHAFISDSPDGPQLYLSSSNAIMGDSVTRPENGMLDLQARVVNGAGGVLEFHTANGCVHTEAIDSDQQTINVSLPVEIYIRAQLVTPADDELVIRAMTNPIYISQT